MHFALSGELCVIFLFGPLTHFPSGWAASVLCVRCCLCTAKPRQGGFIDHNTNDGEMHRTVVHWTMVLLICNGGVVVHLTTKPMNCESRQWHQSAIPNISVKYTRAMIVQWNSHIGGVWSFFFSAQTVHCGAQQKVEKVCRRDCKENKSGDDVCDWWLALRGNAQRLKWIKWNGGKSFLFGNCVLCWRVVSS